MAQDKFTVTFWGVRGGYPMPGPTTVKYGGNTTCVEVQAGQHRIIIDGGTGIIELGKKMMEEHKNTGDPIYATLLLTHTHHDHTQGLPFFFPTRHPASNLNIFGPKLLNDDLATFLDRVMQPPVFPVYLEELFSKRRIEHARHKDTIVLTQPGVAQHYALGDTIPQIPDDAVTINVSHGYNHPKYGILFYRIGYKGHSMVMATDTEGYIGTDQQLVEFASGTDLLIHDSEYDAHEYADDVILRQGWGHSTWCMAVDVAKATNAKQLALTHHSPSHDATYLEEMLAKAQQDYPNTFLAREGDTIQLL